MWGSVKEVLRAQAAGLRLRAQDAEERAARHFRRVRELEAENERLREALAERTGVALERLKEIQRWRDFWLPPPSGAEPAPSRPDVASRDSPLALDPYDPQTGRE